MKSERRRRFIRHPFDQIPFQFNMMVIGLIGGIASGKSFVASCFRDLGAEVLCADQVGHQVLEIPAIAQVIAAEWPNAVDDRGKVIRKELAQIVFRGVDCDQQRKRLEAMVHPLIGAEIDRRLADLNSGGCVAVVLDAPVLIEAGWLSKCHRVVFVEASLATRRSRAAERGWKPDELERRERAQMSLSQKRAAATDIVSNDQDKKNTQSQVARLWDSWGLPITSVQS